MPGPPCWRWDFKKFEKTLFPTLPGFDMYMIGTTGDYGDPDRFCKTFYGEAAHDDVNFSSPELDRMLTEARDAASRADKARAYARAHSLSFNVAVRIPIVHSQPLLAARTYAKGWVPSPFSVERFNAITLVGKR